ncbi:biotin--[acetyl-CoA-carboxylase] ligase [Microbacterium halophytorum]|uniref:biotin--[acetyl-CoA-carboxylase] ligase n=1 Tax=Microbacterium halophytorum TaxID=2067568 RepID=UPI000CFACB3F|nr:biotin--[acetyl-CoA-carboxylase] ligase [Microbacterium halophytorum]
MTWEKTTAIGADVAEVASAGSTNADLAALAADRELPHLSTLLTRDQRAGRGRLDRQWRAPAGASLAVSVLLRVGDVPAASRGWVPLAAGRAMARAVAAQLPGRRVGAKWPNDVLVDRRKICGILAEGTADPGTVIVGSGVNTRMTEAELPVPTATSFAALGAECDEDRLLADYLAELDRMLAALAAASGDADASRVRVDVLETCVTLGQEVRVMMPAGDDIVGTAVTLSGDGRLVVGTASGLVDVAAGDVVHVRPDA